MIVSFNDLGSYFWENLGIVLTIFLIATYIYGLRIVCWMKYKDNESSYSSEMCDFYFWAWILSPVTLSLALIYTICKASYKVIIYGIKEDSK